jgi:RNA polymerase sigma-70 factor (ECF subfamily)
MALSAPIARPETETHDARRFDTLLKEHRPRVYRFAYRLTGCRLDAEDLAQDAFVRAHRAFNRYDPTRPFEQWILRITYRLFIDSLRRRKQPQTYSLDEFRDAPDAELSIAREIPDGRANPESLMMEGTLDEKLETALDNLPDPFRRAVWMADVEGLSYEEIAESMRCSTGTVRSRIHRGRTRLRHALSGLKALLQTAAVLLTPALVSAMDM